jgi:hypothetical protein
MQRALRSFRDAKSSFLWKDARDPRFHSERNGHGVPFTSLVGGQLSFLVGTLKMEDSIFGTAANALE